MRQRGLKEEKQGTDLKPDEGWRYNPGKEALDSWKPDLGRYPKKLKDQYLKKKAIYN